MVAHLVQNSCFCIQRKILIFRETFSYSEEILLYSEKHFHIQRKFYIQWISLYFKNFSYSKKFDNVQWNFCYIQINFSYSEKILYLKKLYIQRKFLCSERIFIFRENVDIHRKSAYSEKTTNLNFKLFEMQLQDFGRCTWYKERKLKQWLKGNWHDSTMLASNEGPSRKIKDSLKNLVDLQKSCRI